MTARGRRVKKSFISDPTAWDTRCNVAVDFQAVKEVCTTA